MTLKIVIVTLFDLNIYFWSPILFHFFSLQKIAKTSHNLLFNF